MTKELFIKFKNELKKENKWFETCSFCMTKRQEALHTATIQLVGNFPYEWQIEQHQKSIERVQEYDTWTQEEKDSNKEYGLKMIQKYQDRLNKYGTPENEANSRFDSLRDSKAFKKLEDIGVSVELVLEGNVFTARLHW